MGCDGGTIPRRDELVKTKKKPEQVDKNAENAAKWKHCALSQQPLRKPIVSCELGKLYNKEAIIEFLLSKEATNEVAKHIKGLSDIKELKLTENYGYERDNADKGDAYVDVHASKFICPVTSIEMNGMQKFCFNWKCCCVLSEKAIKEIKSEVCHKCGIPVAEEDVIIINGTNEEVEGLKEKMDARHQKAKLEKKRKKATSASIVEDKKPKIDFAEPSTSKVTKRTTNGGLTTIKTEKEIKKPASNDSASSTKNKVTSKKLMLPQKAQNEYSIAKDPNASSAFKSLFTSHEKARNQTKAHWVTHNPLYF